MNYNELKRSVKALGYLFFDRGEFNLNVVGVRTQDDGADTFNDRMFVAYRDSHAVAVCLNFDITTDPGIAYRRNPINPRGTGIVVPGQHRGAWKIGEHKGTQALVQKKPMAVYRDNNKNSALDFDAITIERVMGGFNCHRSRKHGTSTSVGRWSAGCQVFANAYDHDVLMALSHRSAAIHGNSFTYTLLTSGQLDG